MKFTRSIKTVMSAAAFAALLASSSMVLSAEKGSASAVKAVASIEAPVNLNTADASTLAMLNGVGDKKAADIVAYREAHGKFSKVEDILLVKGIGEKTLEKNRARMSVN